MAWPDDLVRRRQRVGERRAVGDRQLQRHEVEAGDRLGHRVLDLQAGVHLEEPERAVGVEQELDRAGADVADGPGGGDGGVRHPSPQVVVDGRATATPR